MRTVRKSLALATLIFCVGAWQAFAQNTAAPILSKSPAELVEILKNPDSPLFDKAKACQRLAVVGTKDAIGPLAALLADEKLSHYARFGLEAIPDPAVDAALRDAATKLQGSQLIGVIDSIGQRKDAQAIGLLKGFLTSGDAAVVSAATGALGHIGTTEAAGVLKETLAQKPAAAADGCLIGADRLAASGKKAEAVALLDAVTKADVPKCVKAAAIGALLRIQQAAAKDLLLAQIQNADRTFFDVGLAAAREMPGADVTAMLVAECAKLPAERQGALIRALGDRKDLAPMAFVLESSKSDAVAVREAAIVVLAKHGDASAAPILLEAALGDADVAQTAKEGLKKLAGGEVDAAMVSRLANAQPHAKVVLFEILGARRFAAATPAVRDALSDGDATVRMAALLALSKLAEPGDIDVLAAKAFAEGPADEVAAAQAALKMAALRMSDRDACATRLTEWFAKTNEANKVFVLELLGKVSGPKALETVLANAKSSDAGLKDAATRVLGGWLAADAAPALLDIAKNDADEKYQTRALRGYIRIARQLQLPAETKLAMFRAAMEVAKRDEERRLAIDILSRIPSVETVTIAASLVDNPALKDAAAEVSVKIATKIVAQEPKAVAAALQKVVDAKPTDAINVRAVQVLGQAQAATK